MTHLKTKKEISVEKFSPGVYHINKETFTTQIIVTQELPQEENLYLHCLSARLQDMDLINRLRNDYTVHRDEEIYARYMHQLTTANIRTRRYIHDHM